MHQINLHWTSNKIHKLVLYQRNEKNIEAPCKITKHH